MSRKLLVLVALLSVAACDKKESAPAPEATETASAAPPAASVAAAAPAAASVDVESLPVEEQYEADAEKEITAANLNAKLDELEKEISAQ